jgi:hypothetical protein
MALSLNSSPGARQEAREVLQARLKELQGKLAAALADKRTRIRNIVALCRSERRAMREQLRARRGQALEQLGHEIAGARASAKHARLARLEEVRKRADTDIAAARAALAVERQHQEDLRRIVHDHRRRRAEVHRLHDIAAQSATVHSALIAHFGALFQKVGPKVKPVPGESRAEALLRYAQTHPEEAHASAEPRAERQIAETRAVIAETKSALRRAPKAPRPPKAPRSTPRMKTPAARPEVAASSPLRQAARPLTPPPKPPLMPSRSAKAKPAPVGSVPARRPGPIPRRGQENVTLGQVQRERAERPGRKKAGARSQKVVSGGASLSLTPRKNRKKGSSPAPATARVTETITAPALGVLSAPPANETAARRTSETVKAPDEHDTAKLAKLIRQDIAEAVRTSKLPKANYSVTTEKYSMGSTINVVASGLPFSVLNGDAFYVEKGASWITFDRDHFRSRYTSEAEGLLHKLEGIVGAYHWDRSDPTTDYYNERFHKSIRLDDSGEMARITKDKLAQAGGENS